MGSDKQPESEHRDSVNTEDTDFTRSTAQDREAQRTLVEAAMQSEAVANNPQYTRKGLDANGMTAELDRSFAAINAQSLAKIKDPEMRAMYIEGTMGTQLALHEASEKYEANEVYTGALKSIKKRQEETVADVGTILAKNAAADNAEVAAINESMKAGKVIPKDDELMRQAEDSERINKIVNDRIKAMHVSAMEDYRRIGFSFDEAYEAASKMANGAFKSIVANAETLGGAEYAHYLIADKERPEANLVPLYERDEKTGEIKIDKATGRKIQAVETETVEESGKKVTRAKVGKDGKPVKMWDSTKYDPSGTLWCSREEIVKLRKAHEAAVQERLKKAAADSKFAGDQQKIKANTAEMKGMALLQDPSGTYDSEKVGEQIAILQSIVATAVSPEAGNEANASLSKIYEKMNTLQRRQKLWSAEFTKLKTKQNYEQLLNDIEREGNVGSLIAYCGYSSEMDENGKNKLARYDYANVDTKQRMFAVIQNGINRGILDKETYGENGTSARSLRAIRSSFSKDNWEEAARFMCTSNGKFAGGTISVDYERSLSEYLAKNGAEKTKLEYEGYGHKSEDAFAKTKFSGIYEVNQETGERMLKDAKYYRFTYEKDGRKYHLTGDDMQALSKAVHNFQMRNKNPTPEMVDDMLKSVFNAITSNAIYHIGTAGDVNIASGALAQVASDYISRYYTQQNAKDVQRFGIDIHNQMKRTSEDEDFNAYLGKQNQWDYSKMVK